MRLAEFAVFSRYMQTLVFGEEPHPSREFTAFRSRAVAPLYSLSRRSGWQFGTMISGTAMGCRLPNAIPRFSSKTLR